MTGWIRMFAAVVVVAAIATGAVVSRPAIALGDDATCSLPDGHDDLDVVLVAPIASFDRPDRIASLADAPRAKPAPAPPSVLVRAPKTSPPAWS